MGIYMLVSTILVCLAFECFLSAGSQFRRRRKHLDVMRHTVHLNRVFLCHNDFCEWVDVGAIAFDDMIAASSLPPVTQLSPAAVVEPSSGLGGGESMTTPIGTFLCA